MNGPQVLLEQMTWPEIEAAIASGKTTAIIVAGASEQHGPHLPEGTDAMIGESLAIRLAWRLGNALVAPVIRPGCSDHHLAFPGTISISPDLLQGIIDAYIASLRQHGFKRFFIFSSHGGNFPLLRLMVQRGVPPSVTVASDLTSFVGVMRDGVRRFGGEGGTIPHADASETGEMLVLHPELVHMDRAERGFVGDVDPEQLMKLGLKAFTQNGVLGNPLGATEDLGEDVLSALVDFLIQHAYVGEIA